MQKRENFLIFGFIVFSVVISVVIASLFYFFSVKAPFIIDFLGIMLILLIVVRNFIIRYRSCSDETSFLRKLIFSLPNFLVLLNFLFIVFFAVPYYLKLRSLNCFFVFFSVVSFIIFVLSLLKLFFRKRSNEDQGN